jgi:integrase
MQARLQGVHTVRRKLVSGEYRTHYYAWRGGPRIEAAPDSKEFLSEYLKLTKHRPQPVENGTLGAIIALYRSEPEFTRLSPATRRSYEPILAAIRQEYGDLPVELLEERGARADFMAWRSTMADRPRTADLHLAVLKRILSFAVDREFITVNKLAGVKPMSQGSRRDRIWSDDQIASVLAAASPEIARAVRLALETGQRQGDLLRLLWAEYKDGVFRIRQSKSGSYVSFEVGAGCRAELDALPRRSETILCNSRGQPWTSDGFRASWSATMTRAGIKDLVFHDLRGTWITRKYAEGWSIKKISEVSGHSERQAEQVIRRHYLAVKL